MKVGDLVKFRKRFRSDDSELYLILERQKAWDNKSDMSPFAKWLICNTATGKIHIQYARELEVII